MPYSTAVNTPDRRGSDVLMARAGTLGARPTQAVAPPVTAAIIATRPPMLQPIRIGGCASCSTRRPTSDAYSCMLVLERSSGALAPCPRRSIAYEAQPSFASACCQYVQTTAELAAP